MKSRYNVFAGIFQIVIGTAAIISFFILLGGNEEMLKWIPTLIVAIGFVVMGIIDIAYAKKQNK